VERAELIVACMRVVDPETEVETTRRAMEVVREAVPPKSRFEAIGCWR
jgi:hypothetical protein